MKLQFVTRLVIATLNCCLAISASGRAIRAWSYEQLCAESDLVAIIEPLENKPAPDKFAEYAYGRALTDFEGINTRFKVHAVLKTGADSPSEITVLHYCYSKRAEMIVNGATFIHFLPGPLQYEKRDLKDGKVVGGMTIYQEKPVWLAFLKRQPDGRFVPLTGQYDPGNSFRELHEASFFAHE